MMHRPVTARLTALKLGFEDLRHGGVALSGDDLEGFIQELDELRDLTRKLEDANPRALNLADVVDLRPLINDNSAKVLNAMRAPESNVRLFPISPRRTPDQGGRPA